MKIIILLLVLTSMGQIAFGQKYFTKSGKISFFSDAPLEKIEAHNTSATAVFDASTGQMEFAVLIKAFQFEKALMQEHFNENYMESGKYPKSTFKGKFSDPSAVNWDKPGTYPVKVTGDLTIHGVTNPVTADGTIVIGNDKKIKATSKFEVAVADYKIEIPKVVRDNIAKIVTIDVNLDLQPLQ